MKHRYVDLIVALLAGALITILLIPLGLSTKQLWVTFFAIVAVVFALLWIFNEYLLYRDLHKVEMYLRQISNPDRKKRAARPAVKVGAVQRLVEKLGEYDDRQTAEVEELHKKAALRKRFIADISHELKSPLFSAQGYVLTLLDGAVKDKNIRYKFLKKAAKNLSYLDTLIQDLLTLSQIESQAIQMLPAHFDIVALVREVLEELQKKAADEQVNLHCNCQKEPVIVYADRDRMLQVLTNLVINGIHYNKPGGQVVVSIEEKEQGVQVAVKDTGVGIAAKYHEQIFNRFFRIDKSRTTKKSTGLGLAIVKHVLENHGTAIELTSAPGQGSTFSFILGRDKPLLRGNQV